MKIIDAIPVQFIRKKEQENRSKGKMSLNMFYIIRADMLNELLKDWRKENERCGIINTLGQLINDLKDESVSVADIESRYGEHILQTLEVLIHKKAGEKELAVKHGHWVIIKDHKAPKRLLRYHKCSNCKQMAHRNYKYCPNCGARMDDKENEVLS